MTSQEARRQVEDCEREIVSAYDDMRSAARTVGTVAASEAANNTAANILLILSVVGLVIVCASVILLSVSMMFCGAMLFSVGIAFGISSRSNSKKVQVQIESQQKNLNSTLDHSKI